MCVWVYPRCSLSGVCVYIYHAQQKRRIGAFLKICPGGCLVGWLLQRIQPHKQTADGDTAVVAVHLLRCTWRTDSTRRVLRYSSRQVWGYPLWHYSTSNIAVVCDMYSAPVCTPPISWDCSESSGAAVPGNGETDIYGRCHGQIPSAAVL